MFRVMAFRIRSSVVVTSFSLVLSAMLEMRRCGDTWELLASRCVFINFLTFSMRTRECKLFFSDFFFLVGETHRLSMGVIFPLWLT